VRTRRSANRRRSAADAAERRENQWDPGATGSKGGVVGEGPAGQRSHVGVPRDFLVGTFRAHPVAAAVRRPPGAAPGHQNQSRRIIGGKPYRVGWISTPSSRRFRIGRRRSSHPNARWTLAAGPAHPPVCVCVCVFRCREHTELHAMAPRLASQQSKAPQSPPLAGALTSPARLADYLRGHWPSRRCITSATSPSPKMAPRSAPAPVQA
jgi:hypothetical protein